MTEYHDHLGYAESALDLLLYHMEKLQTLAADPGEQKVIGGCLVPLALLRDALARLNA